LRPSPYEFLNLLKDQSYFFISEQNLYDGNIIAKRARCDNKTVYVLQKHDCKGLERNREQGIKY